ncbi:hypothetical protein [Pseudanabaena sp. PCC 6802]|uniref:hypothetical protein n=1 Tax=Pseudanabaena sp. PCC 6802 TaxID=118173 RepID=UPI0003616C3C|nr:hypothetical protein [Pseudanabaena sp. PCC 6802]
MTINWTPWDLEDDEFTIFEAACLWLEIEPDEKLLRSCPAKLRVMMDAIVKYLDRFAKPRKVLSIHDGFMVVQGDEPADTRKVKRTDLEKMAKEKGVKPKFLFKAMRADNTQPTTPDLEDKPLHTRVRKSYLRLIKGLLKNAGIEPTEWGIAKVLEGMVTRSGETLGDDKIRGILEELNSQQADENLDLKVVLGILAELKNLDKKPISSNRKSVSKTS